MLLSLLVSTAYAGHFSMALGMGAGAGENATDSWATWGPVTTASYMTHLWFLEGFGGLSSTTWMAREGGQTILAAPLQLEAGLGIGGRAFGVGMFASAGPSGSGGGLYSHLTFATGSGWVKRMGVEGRIVGYDNGTGAVAALWRIEPGRSEKRPDERVPPPPPYSPEDAPVEPVHHDDPYVAR